MSERVSERRSRERQNDEQCIAGMLGLVADGIVLSKRRDMLEPRAFWW